MKIVEEIEARLRKYSGVQYEVSDDAVTVPPDTEDGFEVSLRIATTAPDPEITVYFNGWHEEFSSSQEALNCFAMGLTKECRLKEWSRGEKAYKWCLEILQNGGWEAYSTTSLFFAPFWKAKKVRYLQNNLVK